MDNYYGYAYPQQQMTTGYTQYACAPYASAQLMPSPASHKTLDKQLRNKKGINKSISGVHEFIEELGSQSTDESIHLVRSRRANQANGPSYESSHQMMKKRSQSGTSIMKGMASQLSVPRSQSDERSVSPSLVNEKRKQRKEKRASKKSGSFHSNYDDQDQFTYSTDNRLIDAGYFTEQSLAPQQQYVQQQQQFFQPQMQYGAQFQSQYPQQYFQQQQQQYSAAPGAPCDYYNQSSTQNFQASNPSLSYYQQADAYGSGIQTFHNLPQQPQMENVCTQNLPNGAKIVAEYFLGYLDEQQQYQQRQQQQQQQMAYQQPQMQQAQPVQYPMQYQSYDQPQQQQQVQCPPGCQPAQVMCPPGCVPEMDYSSDSEANKEEVEVEIWEKATPKKEKKSRKSNKSCDDFKKLTDIIETLEKKIGNMSTNGTSEPIQPIFLMPKQAEQTKPIYVPRNIYVPVIRPVFVPRERVIVRPQIIHVARPVLVDRPVPIQQRPLVIERDRPVPVRVETLETNCNETSQAEEASQEAGEPCVDKPGVVETTYHEFTQDSHHFETGSVAASALTGEEANANKQLVMDLLEEAERRKNSMQSKSNEMLNTSTSVNHNQASSILDSVPYSAGYTLEVLDQRVSDKFERVDEETIKSRYGVDSFQYLPDNGGNNNMRSSVGGSYKSLASNGNAGSVAEFAADGAQASGSNGNLSSILTDLAKITASK